MRKILVRGFGGPEVLELVDADRPVPGPGQVLVEVRAIGVNPADWKLRVGRVPKYGKPPFTPGLDFSGVTDAGQEVYGVAFPSIGSYAEYITVDVDALAPKPSSVDFEHAAALPVAALT
ncbi:zinc-binding alcohol dehydrogenase family protein, partial [Kibdelosporangium lantanae]